jgi:hypothetical protein
LEVLQVPVGSCFEIARRAVGNDGVQVEVAAEGDDEINFIADIGLERRKQYRTGAIAETGDTHPALR